MSSLQGLSVSERKASQTVQPPIRIRSLAPACMMLLCASVRGVKRVARPISGRVFAQGLLRARATSKPIRSFFSCCLIDLLSWECDKGGWLGPLVAQYQAQFLGRDPPGAHPPDINKESWRATATIAFLLSALLVPLNTGYHLFIGL